jgi:hypothetical protein
VTAADGDFWLPPETLFRWHNWAVLGAFATP